MPSFLARSFCLGFLGLGIVSAGMSRAQEAPSPSAGPMMQPPSRAPKVESAPAEAPPPAVPAGPVAIYDPAIFEKRIPADQLTFLKQFAGAPSGELMQDKQFRKLLKTVMPDCMFHYGRDRSLSESMDMVIGGSRIPVQVREGRYLLLSGTMGAFLEGRGFAWFDLQEGIGVGGFYFHPTNGEPTPALNLFSRQVKEDSLSLGQMPPGLVEDLSQWTLNSGVPPVTTRYFLTGSNRKILLEHDENYCLSWSGMQMGPDSGCEQMAADAADMDLTAAYYLDATHHATNATAWMMSQDQISFIEVRNTTCRAGPDPLGCRILMTRERTRVIVKRGPSVPGRPVRG